MAGDRRFEELAWEPTPIGEVSLRRRQDPVTDVDIFEVKLGDEYLMSSQFTVGEIALAELGLGWLQRRGTPTTGWEIVVGGLGLGYTADAVLADDRVRQLIVVDALAPVISWHRRELLPLESQADHRPSVPVGARRLLHDVSGGRLRPGDPRPPV